MTLPLDPRRAHHLIALPLLGFLLSLHARARAPAESRPAWNDVVRLQGAAAGVVALHAGLQAMIVVVGWTLERADPAPPLDRLVPIVLSLSTLANLVSGLAEYGLLAFFALRAARGHPLPLLGARKRPPAR